MRRLLVVDSSVTSKSPTMRGWLSAARTVLPQRFDEVEVWAFNCELEEHWVKWRKLKPVTGRWAIQSIFYERAVRRMIAARSPNYLAETLVQCSGTHLAQADIRYIQFWNKAFAEAATERPEFLRLPLKDRLVGRFSIEAEEASLNPGRTGEWWCVSRGIAQPIIRDSAEPPIVRYLPNAHDPIKFNPEVRKMFRGSERAALGFSDDEIVLAFSAFGHFERKGLRQAVDAVRLLVARGHPVRLLVIGGTPATIESFRKKMYSRNKEPMTNITFIGLTDNVVKPLSAADAFLMPSHFEAFSLAEIEAAALGLRLYLTAHPGHEMILREPLNGRLLPWDPGEMAAVLEDEIKRSVIRTPHQMLGEALDPAAYARTMGAHYDQAISRKWDLQ